MSPLAIGIIAFCVLVGAAIIITLFVLGLSTKDCDCAKEGETCVVFGKATGVKFMDVEDNSKFIEKTFIIIPPLFKCDASYFDGKDPSPGKPKKCSLTRSKLSFC